MSDNINPDHYKRLPVEAIEIIESAIQGAPSVQAGYLHGQGLKYGLRTWEKGNTLQEYLVDIYKNRWYVDRLANCVEDLIAKETSEAKTESDSIPDGWRELEPKDVPSKGDRFWSDGEWHELLVDGAVEYEYHSEKFIRKIDPHKPAFAVGDRVKDTQGFVGVVKNVRQSNGECEVQLDGNHKYVYRWSSELSAVVDLPKPAFSVGDRVRVCKPGSFLDGLEGVIHNIVGADRIGIKSLTGQGFCRASELQAVEVAE